MAALNESAIEAIARAAHADQVDKQGRDYLRFHILPVVCSARDVADTLAMSEVDRLRVIYAAYLHDIVEDTAWEVADVAAVAGEDIAQIVDAVTRRDETYAELISRACAHRLAAAVKLADNTINIASGLHHQPQDPALRAQFDSMRTRRYLPARARLCAALDLSPESSDDLLLRARAHVLPPT